jgi:hypothetical protein
MFELKSDLRFSQLRPSSSDGIKFSADGFTRQISRYRLATISMPRTSSSRDMRVANSNLESMVL